MQPTQWSTRADERGTMQVSSTEVRTVFGMLRPADLAASLLGFSDAC